MIPRFIAWHIAHKSMCDISEINFYTEQCVLFDKSRQFPSCFDVEFSECILMQSTGLLDKNGVEIFEGDVVTNWQSTGYVINKAAGHSASVEWKVGRFGFDLLRFVYKDIAIIGNIHENPELLEQ